MYTNVGNNKCFSLLKQTAKNVKSWVLSFSQVGIISSISDPYLKTSSMIEKLFSCYYQSYTERGRIISWANVFSLEITSHAGWEET